MSVQRGYVGTVPTITDTIRDPNNIDPTTGLGQPVSLSGATVTFRYRPDGAATPVVILAGTPDPDQNANKGKVTIILGSPLMDAVADYSWWWHVSFPDAAHTILETDNNALLIQSHDPTGDEDAGPCVVWITSDDVALVNGAPPGVDFSAEAAIASELLYQWSGRQFPGGCSRQVRPTRQGCGHWWGLAQQGVTAAFPWAPWDLALGVFTRFADYPIPDGCGRLSVVPLPGHVRAVTEVAVNGVVLDPSVYRVDKDRQLVGLYNADGTPVYWPVCQDMRVGPYDTGAFSVTYTWGKATPLAGKRAAAALALQVYNLDHNPAACVLAPRVTRLIRQGVTIERDASKPTLGIPIVDAFLAAYNPSGRRRAAAVYSPDIGRYPRRTG